MTGHVYKKKLSGADGDDAYAGVVMRDGDASSSVTSAESEQAIDRKHRGVRAILTAMFHSPKFHILIIVLTILASLLMVTELLIDLQILQLNPEHRNGPMAAPRILNFITIALLGLFMVETGLKVFAYGPKTFLKHKGDVFDACISALTLGLVVGLGQGQKSSEGVGFIIILRLWRFTKVLNNIVASVKAEGEKRLAKERRTRRALEREVCKLKDYCLQQEVELDTLRMLLRRHSIQEPSTLRMPPTPHTIRVIAEINEYNQARLSELPPTYSAVVQEGHSHSHLEE